MTDQAAQAGAATAMLPACAAQSASSAQVEQAAAAAPEGSTATGAEEGRMVALDVGFGSLHSNRSALEALVCPDYALVRFLNSLPILSLEAYTECFAVIR